MSVDSTNGKPDPREIPSRAEVRSWVAQEIGKLGIDPQGPGDFKAALDKARGDYFADCAVHALVRATGNEDTLGRKNDLDEAKVWALLSHRDAVLESTATLKEVANRQIDSTLDLDQTVKKATNHVVTEMRRANVREAA